MNLSNDNIYIHRYTEMKATDLLLENQQIISRDVIVDGELPKNTCLATV